MTSIFWQRHPVEEAGERWEDWECDHLLQRPGQLHRDLHWQHSLWGLKKGGDNILWLHIFRWSLCWTTTTRCLMIVWASTRCTRWTVSMTATWSCQVTTFCSEMTCYMLICYIMTQWHKQYVRSAPLWWRSSCDQHCWTGSQHPGKITRTEHSLNIKQDLL